MYRTQQHRKRDRYLGYRVAQDSQYRHLVVVIVLGMLRTLNPWDALPQVQREMPIWGTGSSKVR